MKFFRLDLLTLLISLFILGSCKNQNDIGLPVEQQLSGTLLVYDDIVVKTDSDNVAITSTSSPKTPLSSLNDPALGVTESAIAAAISLPGSAAYTVPTGTITTDSVIMELRYREGFYGDSLNSKYKLKVQQLDERVLSSAYNSNKAWAFLTPLLNDPARSGAFNVRPKTAVKTFNIIKGAKDTLRLVAPHLRVPLAPAFFVNNLFNAPASQIASNDAFQRAVKGLYLTLERDQAAQAGGTLMFNIDSSSIKVYYRVVNEGVTDTAMVSMPFSIRAPYVKSKKADLSNYPSTVQNAIRSTASNNEFYIQGLSGLRAKVSFPTLKTIFGSADLTKIAINRAELVVTSKAGTDLPPFVAQPQLSLYRLSLTQQRTQLPDANGTGTTAYDLRFFGAPAFGGNYISTTKEYHFVVTGYVQDLIRGKLTDYGTYIGAIDTLNKTTTVDIASTVQTAGRVIAVGTDKSPQRIKLNIIYTKND